ncbi:MAG: hypothetical protein H0W70_06250, partial [Actinobacteria bacterium]|nr:hypothetical protein [Actinomycetota bacterium]
MSDADPGEEERDVEPSLVDRGRAIFDRLRAPEPEAEDRPTADGTGEGTGDGTEDPGGESPHQGPVHAAGDVAVAATVDDAEVAAAPDPGTPPATPAPPAAPPT